MQKKWHETNVAIILALMVFFPIGLYLLWKSDWDKRLKWGISIVLGLLVASQMFSVEEEKNKELKKTTTNVAVKAPAAITDFSNKIPVYSVSVEKLLSDYENNEIAADDKYRGKIIKVSGYIFEVRNIMPIGHVGGDRYAVLFGVKSDSSVFPANIYYKYGLACYFDAESKSAIASLKTGQYIKIKGLHKGPGFAGIILDHCVIE